jgi:flagellar assembly factor FliW
VKTTTTGPITLTGMKITFRAEMLGWLGATHFVLDPIPDDDLGMFGVLRCTDVVRLHSGAVVPSLQFLVTPPGFLWPRYQVLLDEQFTDDLDLVAPEDAALLAIVTQRAPLERSTVNLFSPIVVNRHTGLADQFVPKASEDEVGWRLRTPVPASVVAGDEQEDGAGC